MKIEIGYYRCRNGSRARVLCVDAPGEYPVVGYIENGADEPDTMTWTLGGRVSTQETYTSIDDLIEPWREPVRVSGFMVFPRTGPIQAAMFANSREEAENIMCDDCVMVPISGTEEV